MDQDISLIPEKDMVRNLPDETRKEICDELDVEKHFVKDCRDLAGQLGMSRGEVNVIWKGGEAGKHLSPTNNVLNWWQVRNDATVRRLVEILRDLKRDDVVEIIMKGYRQDENVAKKPAQVSNEQAETDDLSWIEANLLNDNFTLKDEHRKFLASLPWIQNFGIAAPNKECKALHLFIICKVGEVPCVNELKKGLGDEISYLVEFVAGTDEKDFEYLGDDGNCDNNTSLTTKMQLISDDRNRHVPLAAC